MATETRTLRTRWSMEAAEDISRQDAGQLEDMLMMHMKEKAWTAPDLHRDFDAYEAYDDLQ